MTDSTPMKLDETLEAIREAVSRDETYAILKLRKITVNALRRRGFLVLRVDNEDATTWKVRW